MKKDLMNAIRTNDLKSINHFFSKIDFYEENDENFPLIIGLSLSENVSLVEYCLNFKDKFNIHAQDRYQNNALNALASNSKASLAVVRLYEKEEPNVSHLIAQLLLNSDIELDTVNKFGLDPFLNSIIKNKEELTHVIISSNKINTNIVNRLMSYHSKDENTQKKLELFKAQYEKELFEKAMLNKESSKTYKI